MTTVVCLVLLVVTLPLWLIPPFFALIPPLLWGWLTYRVMTYDALALHATRRRTPRDRARARWPLLAIGIVSGLLGSLPTDALGVVGMALAALSGRGRGDDLDLRVHPRFFGALVRALLPARARTPAGRDGAHAVVPVQS